MLLDPSMMGYVPDQQPPLFEGSRSADGGRVPLPRGRPAYAPNYLYAKTLDNLRTCEIASKLGNALDEAAFDSMTADDKLDHARLHHCHVAILVRDHCLTRAHPESAALDASDAANDPQASGSAASAAAMVDVGADAGADGGPPALPLPYPDARAERVRVETDAAKVAQLQAGAGRWMRDRLLVAANDLAVATVPEDEVRVGAPGPSRALASPARSNFSLPPSSPSPSTR